MCPERRDDAWPVRREGREDLLEQLFLAHVHMKVLNKHTLMMWMKCLYFKLEYAPKCQNLWN